MTFKELIDAKNKRLETIPDEFLSNVEKYQKKLLSQIIAQVKDLDIKDGFIVVSKPNLDKVDIIIDELRTITNRGEYLKAVKAFLGEFDTQKTINNKYFNEVFNISETRLAKQVFTNAKNNAANLLLGTPKDEAFLMPLRTILDAAVSAGSVWTDTITAIQDFARGKEGEGKLLRYAKQIAHDHYALADRAFVTQMNDEAESEWFLYSGGVIETSRPFCIKRHEKYFDKATVESWADEDWAGKMPGTNKRTIFVTCGGFNCMHTLMGVPKEDVPKEFLN